MKQGTPIFNECPACKGSGIRPVVEGDTIHIEAGDDSKIELPTHVPCDECDGTGKIMDYFEREFNPED